MTDAADRLPCTRDARGVVTLRLDRPERRNAFDEDMAERMGRLFSALGRDAGARLLLIEGAGPHFCAGFDIASRARLSPEAGMRMMAETFAALRHMPIPTIAVVRGAAIGGGLGLVAACDVAIACADAVFACPEGRWGLLPAVVLPYIVGAVGRRNAVLMAGTGNRIDARQAQRIGLISEVAADEEALITLRDSLVSAFLGTGPDMARALKPFIDSVAGRAIDADLIADATRAAADNRSSADVREGFAAFREKRRPAWVTPPD